MTIDICEKCDKPKYPLASTDTRALGGICCCNAAPMQDAIHRAKMLREGNLVPKKAKPAEPLEHDIQCAFFQMVRLHEERHPVLKMVFAIPNAGAGAQRGQAGKMKAEGVRAGIPDIFCAVPVGIDSGWWCEFKRPKAKLRPEQKEMGEQLLVRGYSVCICYSAEEAWLRLRDYLKPLCELPDWNGLGGTL